MNIAIYTNILTPYRVFFYNSMYEECKCRGDNFYVLLMSDMEPNRKWTYSDYKTDYTILLEHISFSFRDVYIHYNSNLIKTLKTLNLDILICAGSYLCPGIWSALKYQHRLGYRIYFWSESHLNEERNYSNIKFMVRHILRRNIYRRFDGFWYAGKMSKHFIEAYCRKNAEFYFVPNLVEEDKYKKAISFSEKKKEAIRMTYEVEKNKVVFVCPARLSPVKGIDRIIPILAKTKDKNNVTMLVAGDGELKDKIVQIAKENELDVRLLGFMNQDAIIELYGIADVFLLPSLSDPNPLSCIEALWAGLPLFISEHCGNYPEVIKHGENGYCFSYQEIDEAINNLETIISADDEWKSKARTISIAIAEEHYKTKRVVSRLLTEMEKTTL